MKSHYIHKEYINNFVENDKILVYDKRNHKFLQPLCNANNIAFEKDLYRLELTDLSDYFQKDLSSVFPNWNPDGIERILKEFEDEGIELVRKICNQQALSLSDDEKVGLLAYLILAGKRTKTQKSFIEQTIPKIISQNETKNMFLRDLLNKNDLNSRISNFMENYNWILLYSQEKAFVFSDEFAVQMLLAPPEVFIPLTCSIGLLLKHKTREAQYSNHTEFCASKLNKVNLPTVIELNHSHQIVFAQRWIFGAYNETTKFQVNWLAKKLGNNYEIQI